MKCRDVPFTFFFSPQVSVFTFRLPNNGFNFSDLAREEQQSSESDFMNECSRSPVFKMGQDGTSEQVKTE